MEKFKEYLNLEGYSNNSYHYLIGAFLREIGNEEISEDLIKSFILEKKKTASVETVNGFIKALRVYLKFLNKDIQVPKIMRPIEKLPDSIGIDFFEKEVIRVVDCIFIEPQKIKAVLYFLFYTGVRAPSEIVNIQRKDINLKDRVAKIFEQKKQKERLIVFPEKLAKMLNAYFTFEPEESNAFNISKSKINYIFNTLKPHFPNIRMRPRLFRHSFATHCLKQGMDISVVSKFLGHTNIQSTLRYLGTNDVLLKELYDKYIH